MSGRSCEACGRAIPAEIFVQGGENEIFCPWCATSQSAAAAPATVAVSVEAGHPKVRRIVEGDAITYATRMGSCFGWAWLIFTLFHGSFMFYGMAKGVVKVNGRNANPEWWYFALLALFYTPSSSSALPSRSHATPCGCRRASCASAGASFPG